LERLLAARIVDVIRAYLPDARAVRKARLVIIRHGDRAAHLTDRLRSSTNDAFTVGNLACSV
jgi:hypothetical protein